MKAALYQVLDLYLFLPLVVSSIDTPTDSPQARANMQHGHGRRFVECRYTCYVVVLHYVFSLEKKTASTCAQTPLFLSAVDLL